MALTPERPARDLAALVFERAAAHPDRIALRRKDRGIWKAVTWSELAARVRAVGRGLAAADLRPGDVAGVLARTRPEGVFADLGIITAGGVSLCLSPDEEAERIAGSLRRSGCRLLFVEDEEQLDKALAARASCPALARIVVFDMRGLRDFADPGCESLAAFLAGAALDGREPAGEETLAPDRPCLMFPGVERPLTHGEVLAALAAARETLALAPSDERLALLPLSDPLERIHGLYAGFGALAVTNCPEGPDTLTENLQELQPTALGADVAFFRRLHERFCAAAAAAGPVQAACCRRALAGRGGLVRGLARLLVVPALRRELGLARLRLAYLDGALPADVAAWLSALGVAVRSVREAAPAAPQPRRGRAGRGDIISLLSR